MSGVPTLAASAVSLSDDGKVSAAGDQTDLDVGSASPLDASAQDEKHDEKHGALARQPTATSNTGKAIEKVETRQDGEEYPTGMKLTLIVIALCLSVFVMALGKRRCNTKLPGPS
jgi:hypothetical protein